MRSICLFMVLVVIVLSSIVSNSQTQGSDQNISRTDVRLFEPWNPHGLSIGIAVQQTLSGKCFAPSAASPTRQDAWRCSAGNAIQDPCYMQVMGDQNQLACAADPWSANVNLFTLEGSISAGNAKVTNRDDALPWALELSDGSKCTLMTGGTYMMAGMRANYGCSAGDRTLFGDIDRSQKVWRIFSHTDKSIALTQSTITVAWY